MTSNCIKFLFLITFKQKLFCLLNFIFHASHFCKVCQNVISCCCVTHYSKTEWPTLTDIYCLSVPEDEASGSSLTGCWCIRVSHGVQSHYQPGCSLWRLEWAQRTCFQAHSHGCRQEDLVSQHRATHGMTSLRDESRSTEE